MCGISGIINFNNKPICPEQLKSMMSTIKHRGPDSEGTYVDKNFGLGHVRLSIQDLSSAGNQPMFSDDERYSIVFNGEIYNFIEIKEQLSSKYNFKTKTDTEVILAAYIEWGEDCLDKFNGDWAFVIYDKFKHTFFGARDRYGIKPFYYFMNDSQFIFASEIKAITQLFETREANDKLIYEYLVYNRTDHSNETFFKNIYKLQHGHSFKIESNIFSIKKWYNLSEKLSPIEFSPLDYRREIKSSIKLRLRSDVPLGVSLSGGIDSSAITSILIHDFKLKDINTFSAIYKNQWADESEFIEEYSDALENMYFVSPNSNSFYDDFKKFIYAQGEPVSNIGPYAQYKVMELASKNVVVTLDGQGADEQLAGYHYFFGGYFKELVQTFKLMRLIKEMSCYIKMHRSSHAFKYLAFYFLPSIYKNKIGGKIYGSLNKNFQKFWENKVTINDDLYNPNSLNQSLLQHFEFKLEHLLKWDDLNSMNFSIESRVPFLDHNLVEKTLSSSASIKIKNGWTKHILRDSVKDILPDLIYKRVDKKGFSTPSDYWFRTPEFKEYILDTINSKDFSDRDYFDIADCNKKYSSHLNNKVDISKDIWKWINIDVWFKQFID